MHENATDRAAGPDTAVPPDAKTAPRLCAWLRGAMRAVIDLLLTWRERSRQRRALATLGDDLLKDIGISRAEAHGESIKSAWRE